MKYVLSTEVQSRDASDDSSTESSGLKDWAIDRDGLEVEVAISAICSGDEEKQHVLCDRDIDFDFLSRCCF
jgi:hypothetical protein